MRRRIRGIVLLAAVLAIAGLGEARASTFKPDGPAGGLLLSAAGGCGTAAIATNVGSFVTGGKGRIACGAGGSLAAGKKTRTLNWSVGTGDIFTAISFGLSNPKSLRKKAFSIEAGGVSWSIAERRKEGSMQWITVLFAEAVDRAQVVFNAKGKFGLHDVRVLPAPTAPIPLPAAGLLLGAGLVTLAGLGRRRRATA